MTRKIIQDIVVKNKKSSLSKEDRLNLLASRKKPEPVVKEETVFYEETDILAIGPNKERVSKNSRIFLWLLGLALIATAFFLMSSVFARATITVTPKNESISMNDIYTVVAKKESPGLHYEVMTIDKTATKSLETDGEENVERKAMGTVVIYNNYGSQNQRLINNTRLETSTGLIYRIRESVDVPGIKTINGTKTPGSVAVEVIADQAGEKYNMKVSDLKGDFTIPGFKGSPKFEGFYARLSSDISGGYIGKVKKVSESKLSSARNELKNNLKLELIKSVYSQKPGGYIIFDNNYYVEMSDLLDSSSADNYIISEKGTIHAIMFNEAELSSFLAKNKIKDFDNSKVDALLGKNFSTELSGSTEKPWTENSLKVRFSGDAKISWSYDKDKIISGIAGENESVIRDIEVRLRNSIESISSEIQPFWQNDFPKNPEKIKIFDSVRNTSM